MIQDTNGLSAMADGDPALELLLERATEVALPAIVIGEYRYGIRQSRYRARYERWLAEAIATCRILVVDEGTAERYAEIRHELRRNGRAIPANDVWIAALSRQHTLPVISRDQHFELVPRLKRLGW